MRWRKTAGVSGCVTDATDAFQALAAMHGARWHAFLGVMPEPRFYFETDHLNRAGVEAFFERGLCDVLVPPVPRTPAGQAQSSSGG